MITDRLPRSKALLEEFGKSDRMTSLALPEGGRLVALAKSIEEAMLSEKREMVSRACQEFLAASAEFYGVPKPTVRVLASRPLASMTVVGAPSCLGIMNRRKLLFVSGCGHLCASKSPRLAPS
jgi:hypothetical protein